MLLRIHYVSTLLSYLHLYRPVMRPGWRIFLARHHSCRSTAVKHTGPAVVNSSTGEDFFARHHALLCDGPSPSTEGQWGMLLCIGRAVCIL